MVYPRVLAASLIVASMTLNAGCAGTDNRISDAAISGDPDAMAADGLRLNTNGSELVEKGNRNIDRSQAEIRGGRMLMERGSVLVRNSERLRLGQVTLPMPTEASR